eukprot:1138712-Pelagomonas_calceolata.AAC.3
MTTVMKDGAATSSTKFLNAAQLLNPGTFSLPVPMKFLFAFQDTARKLRICTKERNQRGKRRQQKQPGIVYLMNRLQHSSVALAGLPLLTGTAVSSFCEDGIRLDWLQWGVTSQGTAMVIVANCLMRHELMDLPLAVEDHLQADPPSSLAEGPPCDVVVCFLLFPMPCLPRLPPQIIIHSSFVHISSRLNSHICFSTWPRLSSSGLGRTFGVSSQGSSHDTSSSTVTFASTYLATSVAFWVGEDARDELSRIQPRHKFPQLGEAGVL